MGKDWMKRLMDGERIVQVMMQMDFEEAIDLRTREKFPMARASKPRELAAFLPSSIDSALTLIDTATRPIEKDLL